MFRIPVKNIFFILLLSLSQCICVSDYNISTTASNMSTPGRLSNYSSNNSSNDASVNSSSSLRKVHNPYFQMKEIQNRYKEAAQQRALAQKLEKEAARQRALEEQRHKEKTEKMNQVWNFVANFNRHQSISKQQRLEYLETVMLGLTPEDINLYNSATGQTILHRASIMHDLDLIKFLISKGSNPYLQTVSPDRFCGSTVAHIWAAQYRKNQTKWVRRCLTYIMVAHPGIQEKKSVLKQSQEGLKPIDLLSNDLRQEILVSSADVHWYAQEIAIDPNDITSRNCLRYLFQQNPDLKNLKDQNNKTPLDYLRTDTLKKLFLPKVTTKKNNAKSGIKN